MLVYLTIGIWRNPNTNKQNPTLVQYGVRTQNVPTYTYRYKK